MGDHLALLVDRLLTESTLQAAIESRKQAQFSPDSLTDHSNEMMKRTTSIDGELVECRICQEEDASHNMEVPCSCSGSLKYAHRKCVQRWCNEKGDTTCEICLQQFRPGYTAPLQLFHYGSIPMNFRGNWAITRQNLRDSHILTMIPSDRGFTETVYDEDYSASNMRSMVYCRYVTATLILLLVLRQTLPFVLNGEVEYSFALVTPLVLRIAGILLPIFAILKMLSAFHCRRRRRALQETEEAMNSLPGERDHGQSVRLQPHLIQIQ